MPELPEVEEYGRYIVRHALGRRILRPLVLDDRILGATRREAFVRRLRGRTFTRVRRHGKRLFVYTDGKRVLHLHFGMTGDLASYRDEAKQPRFAKIVFRFDDGSYLAFEDVRLFGVAELVDDPDAYIVEHSLGRDPLDPKFTVRDFVTLMRKRKGAIKALLMSQEVVAGLGNLYVDETLYETGIHPRRAADRLTDDDLAAIYKTMRRIVKKPVRHLPREEDERCPRCRGTIKRTVAGGRTTYYCSHHQT